MRSTFSGLNAVMRGMYTQKVALDTVGHNIANSGTDGYSRQTVNFGTANPDVIYGARGALFVGTGVNVESITRARDTFTDHQLWKEMASLGYGEMTEDTMDKIQGVFIESQATGLQSVLDNFWESWQTLGGKASDDGARMTVRQRGVEVVDAIQHAQVQLRDMIYDINSVVDIKIDSLNQITSELASLNKQISGVEFNGANANDLRDRRDSLIDELSKLTKVTVYEDQRGNYSVQSAGVTLVDAQGYTELATMDDTAAPLSTDYGYVGKVVIVKGTTQKVAITGGELGGMLKARDTDINSYLDNLATMSQFLLTEFNAVHAAGYGTDDSTGNNFFGAAKADGVDYTTWPGTTPKGDWLQALTVNKDLFDPADGLAKIAAKTKPGTGTDTQGNASGDNAVNLGNLLKLDSSTLLGNASLDTYFSTIIGKLGVDTENSKRLADNQTTLVNQILNRRESVAGVNMDEEITNMIRFQKGYNAAARVVTTVDEMLDKLINSTGMVGR